MTTYYISNAGGGSGASAGSPFKFSDLWGVVAAGDTALVLDGTYTGANSMIVPTPGLNGTSGNRITISAINDGQVLIDGQNARIPVRLVNNSYWTLQGFRAGRSSDEVVGFEIGSNFNIARRVTGYDAAWIDGNTIVFWSFGNTGNLMEDCVAFGTGRKMFGNSQGGNDCVFRRCFGQFFKNTTSTTNSDGPVFTLQYESYNGIAENCIGTWDQDPGTSGFGESGILGGDHFGTNPANAVANSKYLGCIALILSTQSIPADLIGGIHGIQYADGQLIENCVSYIEQNRPPVFLMNLSTDAGYDGPSVGGHIYKNCTEIGPGTSLVQADWTVTNRRAASTVAAAYGTESLYINNGSKGATIRYRYVDGTLTNQELWPWPMNQRMIDDMTAAGYTPVDVNATIQAIFGAFPNSPTFTTYYVSKTGSDSNSGTTSAQPKLTIAAGVTLLSSGDQLMIGPGVYTESLRDLIPSGATIKAVTPDTVTLRPTGGTDVIRLNADDITIDSIDADAVNCSGAPYEMGNSGNGVSRCIIKNGRARNGSGVTVDGTDNQFFNMRVYGNAAALKVQGGSSNLVFNNSVYGNAGSYGLWISSGTGNRAQNNIVYGNTSDTILNQGTSSTLDHNVTTNPQWVNPSTGDFRLQSGSPAIDAGTDLSSYFNTDCVGNVRV